MSGRVFRRCGKCGKRVEGRTCGCGSSASSWAFVVDTNRAGETRKQAREGGFKTRAAAEQALARRLNQQAEGTFIEPSKLTLGAYLDKWIAAGCNGVRPWTLKGYESVVRHHVKPRLGHYRLQSLTKPDLRAFYASLRSDGRVKGKQAGTGLSEKSVHNVHICLRAALADAVEDGLLRTSPASGALKPPKSTPAMATWTREQLAAFLDSVRAERDFALWRLAAYAGLRRGELLGLTWADVKAESLSIQQQLGLDADGDGERDLVAPKTPRSKRAISLDAETVRILSAHRQAQEFERRSWGDAYRSLDLVFCRPDGSPHDPDSITGRFERLVKTAGVRPIRLHDLRHTHATMLLEAGVDISVVSARLGHFDVGFTARVYAHVTERLQRDAAAKLSAYLEPLTANS